MVCLVAYVGLTLLCHSAATNVARGQDRPLREGPVVTRVPIGTRASTGALTLELVRRYQKYNSRPESVDDYFDSDIYSPKSVVFTPSGDKAYVNALEGGTTSVYDSFTGVKLTTISHRLGIAEDALFNPEETARLEPVFATSRAGSFPNRFMGKPVEAVFTHGGRYLWISYYRRDFDRYGVLPSAVAIVDTRSDRIVRVMHTGPIAKFMAPSPDGKWLAVINWGDNSIDLIDIAASQPSGFRHAAELVVEQKLALPLNQHVDRDRYCGFCLRGAVFTSDNRYLLVARMGGGGIAVLDILTKRYLGTVFGMPSTPRHLVLSRDGQKLYISSNAAGRVSVYQPKDIIDAVKAGRKYLKPLQVAETGGGTRTIALSPDNKLLFATVNRESKLIVLDAATLERRLQIRADSYPVGLGVTPDGGYVWVTSQGMNSLGGNSVSVYRIIRAAVTIPQPTSVGPAPQQRKLRVSQSLGRMRRALFHPSESRSAVSFTPFRRLTACTYLPLPTKMPTCEMPLSFPKKRRSPGFKAPICRTTGVPNVACSREVRGTGCPIAAITYFTRPLQSNPDAGVVAPNRYGRPTCRRATETTESRRASADVVNREYGFGKFPLARVIAAAVVLAPRTESELIDRIIEGNASWARTGDHSPPMNGRLTASKTEKDRKEIITVANNVGQNATDSQCLTYGGRLHG